MGISKGSGHRILRAGGIANPVLNSNESLLTL